MLREDAHSLFFMEIQIENVSSIRAKQWKNYLYENVQGSIIEKQGYAQKRANMAALAESTGGKEILLWIV